jgi:hypothetical protein
MAAAKPKGKERDKQIKQADMHAADLNFVKNDFGVLPSAQRAQHRIFLVAESLSVRSKLKRHALRHIVRCGNGTVEP